MNGNIFDLKPHTVNFTNINVPRAFSYENLDEVYIIIFEEIFLKKYIDNNVYEEFPFLLTEEVFPKLASLENFTAFEELYLQIYNEFHNKSRNFKIIGHLFAALLHKYKDYYWENSEFQTEENSNSLIIESFKKLLDKHYQGLVNGTEDKIFQVKDYANALGFHPSYFSAMVKVKTGKPVSKWIAEKTISQSKLLLRNQSISIKEISYRLGFSVPGHFSSYFKKYAGISPKEYRRNLDS
ncbi:helix-turn-helix domain-containing protein [Chryseobacterium sp. MEBOG07]|uniref:helix-turn-helix domain-containing protein n=1 Tax=Chryseobacterium sp. MEBOG07 TaxID=2879939 RepID=UPI001F2310B4|nr:response regulator transcription factor [Chryseobacterium sp. MEBOG07]UKB78326.1 helix-turn-helix transcriptional regulator [Chryseobacterium sp. MEBOG07]